MRTLGFGRWRLGALLALAIAGARPAAADEQAFAGAGVSVTASGCPPDTAKRVGDLLIASLPRFPPEMPLRMPAKEVLVVHLYGTAKEYRDAVTAAKAPNLVDNFAGTANSTHQSYLLLQPRANPAAIEAAGGVPEMTRWLLLHEATHQIAQRADVAAEGWPDWYAEGMAEHVAKALLRASSPAGSPPSMAEQDKAHRALDAAETGRLPRLDQLLHPPTEDASARRAVYYAAWGALYDLLASDPTRLAALHARVRVLDAERAAGKKSSAREAEDRFAAALERAYGPAAALEKRFEAAVRASKAEWFEGSRSTQRVGDAWLCTAFPESTAYALRVRPAPGVPFTVETTWTLADVGGRQAEVYLGFRSRENPRFLKVAFRSAGSVTLLALADGSWQERLRANAEVEPALLACSVPHHVALDVDASRLRVEVDGKTTLETSVPEGFDVLGGCVGFGVDDGFATFRGFEVKPRP